jgi:hypothetical protein
MDTLLTRITLVVAHIQDNCLDYAPLNGDWSTIGVGLWINTPRSLNEFVLMMGDKEIGTINQNKLKNN